MNEQCPLEAGVGTPVSALPEVCQRNCGDLMYEGEFFVKVGGVALSDEQLHCLHDSHIPGDIEPAVLVGGSVLTKRTVSSMGNGRV